MRYEAFWTVFICGLSSSHSQGYKIYSPDTPENIFYKSIAGRYQPVRVADGPITARYTFIKNASWDVGDGLTDGRTNGPVPLSVHNASPFER